jgi:hypothetical protein
MLRYETEELSDMLVALEKLATDEHPEIAEVIAQAWCDVSEARFKLIAAAVNM